MTQKTTYDRTKQHYLDQFEILNGRAFNFYLKLKKQGLSEYQIRRRLWLSKIWHEAKVLFKELNIHLYGHLTCEKCFVKFYSTKIYSFQLHHDPEEYNWEKLFDPEKVLLIHKHCHKEFHNITRREK